MRISLLVLSLSLLGSLTACEGSGLQRPIGGESFLDTGLLDDTRDQDVEEVPDGGADAEEPGDTADTLPPDDAEEGDTQGPEEDTEPTVPAPKLEFWLEGEDGPLGKDSQVIFLSPSDEPEAYRAEPGFQIDIAFSGSHLDEGKEVKLYLNGESEGSVLPSFLDDDASGSFLKVDFGEYGTAESVLLVGEGQSGSIVQVFKTLEWGPPEAPECLWGMDFVEEGTCVNDASQPLTVKFTREDGECGDIQASINGMAHTPLNFDENGEAQLPIDLNNLDSNSLIEVRATVDGSDTEHTLEKPFLTDEGLSLGFSGLAVGQALTFRDDGSEVAGGGFKRQILVDVSAHALSYPLNLELSIGDGGDGGNEESLGSLNLTDDSQSEVAFDVNFQETGNFQLFLRGSTSCSSSSLVDRRIRVLAKEEDLSWQGLPVNNTFLAKDNEDSSGATGSTYKTTLSVESAVFLEGETVEVACQAAGGAGSQVLGTGTVVNGQADLALSVDVDGEKQSQVCRIYVGDAPSLRTGDLGLTFGIPIGTLAVLSPPENACGSGELPILLETERMNGQELTATLSNDESQSRFDSGTVENDSLSLAISLASFQEGPYVLSFSGTDIFGNVLDESLLPTVDFVLDKTAPSMDLLPLGPFVDGENGVEVVNGIYLYDLSIPIMGVRTDSDEICLSLNAAEADCQTVAPGDTSVVFQNLPLRAGENTLTGYGKDSCGNESDPVTGTIEVSYDAPLVSIVSPETGLITVSETIDIEGKVDVDGIGNPSEDLSLQLLVEDQVSNIPVEGPDNEGNFAFRNVPLNEGSTTTLQVTGTATGFSKTGYSNEVKVFQKNALPSIALDFSDAYINLSSPLCEGSSSSAARELSATTDAENGSEATLNLICNDEPAGEFRAEVEDGKALFLLDGALEHGLVCEFQVKVTDLAGQESDPSSVFTALDCKAPSVSILAPLESLDKNLDEDEGKAGIQSGLEVAVSGLPEGAVVTATLSSVDPLDGIEKVLHATLTEDVSDDGSLAIEIEEDGSLPTWPLGELKLTVTVQDAAGNEASTSTTLIVTDGALLELHEILPVGACSLDGALTLEGKALYSPEGTGIALFVRGPEEAAFAEESAWTSVLENKSFSSAYEVSAAIDGNYSFYVASVDQVGKPIQSNEETVLIDRQNPVLSFLPPFDVEELVIVANDGSFEDAYPTRPGFQIDLALKGSDATSSEGSSLCLYVNDVLHGDCQELSEDSQNSLSFSAVTLVPGANTLRVEASDACGNSTILSRQVELQYLNALAIRSPENGSQLQAVEDQDGTTPWVFDTDFQVLGEHLVLGSDLSIACRPAGSAEGTPFTEVGSITPISGLQPDAIYEVPVSIDVTGVDDKTFECQARSSFPSESVSEGVEVTFAVPAPVLQVALEDDKSCFIGDVGLRGSFDHAFEDGPEALVVEVYAADESLVISEALTVSNDQINFNIDMAGQSDGQYSLKVRGQDRFLNPVKTLPEELSFAYDTSLPDFEVLAPEAVLLMEDDLDEDPENGFQTHVKLAVTDFESGDELCLAVGLGGGSCQTISEAISEGAVVFASVTLQPGTNTLSIWTKDSCGNLSEILYYNVELVISAPKVEILSPYDGEHLSDTTVDIEVLVTDGDDVPLDGMQLVLHRNDVPEMGYQATAVADQPGHYVFHGVDLLLDQAQSFVVSAGRSDYGEIRGQSQAHVVYQKSELPGIEILSPDAGLIGQDSGFCAQNGGSLDFSTTNVEDASAVSLSVLCNGTELEAEAQETTVTNNAGSFSGIHLPENESCDLKVLVVDAAGQSESDEVSVQLSCESPEFIWLSPTTESLLVTDDEVLTQSGIQTALHFQVENMAIGDEVSVSLTSGNNVRIFESQVVDNNGVLEVAFEDPDSSNSGFITWLDGHVTVNVTGTNAHGNLGTAHKIIQVVSNSSIRITSPTDGGFGEAPACGSSDLVLDGHCYRKWSSTSNRSLIVTALNNTVLSNGNNLRVCSNAIALADEPGAIPCVGLAYQGYGDFFEVARANVSTSSPQIVNLRDVLPSEPQMLIAEIRPTDEDRWVSSMLSSGNARFRRVVVDTVLPVVSHLEADLHHEAPDGILNLDKRVFGTEDQFLLNFSSTKPGMAKILVNNVNRWEGVIAEAHTSYSAPVALPNGTPRIVLVVTDDFGNTSPTSGGDTLVYQPTVNLLRPSLVFSKPSSSPLGMGNDLNVSLESNAIGKTVSISCEEHPNEGPYEAVVGQDGKVAFPHDAYGILSDGTHRLRASVTNEAGNSRTGVETSPESIFVKTSPPQLAITSPMGPVAEVTSSRPTLGLSVSQDTVRWEIWAASNCNSNFENCEAPYRVAGPSSDVGVLVQRVSLAVTEAESFHQLTLIGEDAVGNTASATLSLKVVLSSCELSFTNLPSNGWYNTAYCVTANESCQSTDVEVKVALAGACSAVTAVTLWDNTVNPREALGTQPVQGSSVTFMLTIYDGVDLSLSASRGGTGADIGTASQVYDLKVDLGLPKIRFVEDEIGAFKTPGSNGTYFWGLEDDADPDISGFQFHAMLRLDDPNLNGGSLGALVAEEGNVTLPISSPSLPMLLSTAGTDMLMPLYGISLEDGAHHIRIHMEDAAGNKASTSFRAVLDSIPPEPVAFDEVYSVNPRRPSVALSWLSVGDDPQHPLPEDYLIRYAYHPITEANWDETCDPSELLGSSSMPGPLNPGNTMDFKLAGPDPRPFSSACKLDLVFPDDGDPEEAYLYIAIRAVDGVGNLSPLVSGSQLSLSYEELSNSARSFTFSNIQGAFDGVILDYLTFEGVVLGDLNDQNVDDWVVYSRNSNAFCLFYGEHDWESSEVLITERQSLGHSCLLKADAEDIWGEGIYRLGDTVKPLGDINGDGYPDFAVTGIYTPSPDYEGFAFVYFGGPDALDLHEPDLKIRGLSHQTAAAYTGVCGAGDFDGDGLGDLVLMEPNTGAVHVISGRAEWPATLDLRAASRDALFQELSPLSFLPDTSWTQVAQRNLAQNCGLVDLDLAQDGHRALYVAALGSNSYPDTPVFLFPGQDPWTGPQVEYYSNCGPNDCDTGTPLDQRSIRLYQESPSASQELKAHFGKQVIGTYDMNGDGITDLVAASPLHAGTEKTIYVFDGAKLIGAGGQGLRIQAESTLVQGVWPGANGWIIKSMMTLYGRDNIMSIIRDFDGFENNEGQNLPDLLLVPSYSAINVDLKLNQSLDHNAFAMPSNDAMIYNFSSYNNEASAGFWVDHGYNVEGDGQSFLLTGSRLGQFLQLY